MDATGAVHKTTNGTHTTVNNSLTQLRGYAKNQLPFVQLEWEAAIHFVDVLCVVYVGMCMCMCMCMWVCCVVYVLCVCVIFTVNG